MAVKIQLEVEIPEKFIIESEQESEFAPKRVTYEKMYDVGKTGYILAYRKTQKDCPDEIVTAKQAALDYIRAEAISNSDTAWCSLEVSKDTIWNTIPE